MTEQQSPREEIRRPTWLEGEEERPDRSRKPDVEEPPDTADLPDPEGEPPHFERGSPRPTPDEPGAPEPYEPPPDAVP